MHHSDRPTKYCFTCSTHFRALPSEHEEAEHKYEQFIWTWGQANPREQFP